MTGLMVVALLTTAPAPVPEQTLVFYNARLAQREKRHGDVLTLWLLRNALLDRGEAGTHDGAFRSVLWAATGASAICQDGLARDDIEGGVGLWPIALFNYLLTFRQPDDLPAPWDAFETGRQQRLVSLADVLDTEELQSVSWVSTSCFAPRLALLENDMSPLGDLEDRLLSGYLLKRLLAKSLTTLDRTRVTSLAAIEARLFDLDLALIELRNRRARERSVEASTTVRGANMSAGAGRAAGAQAARLMEDPATNAFLRRTLRWAPAEWLTLSRGRREFLFANARTRGTDAEALRTLTLGVLDALVARNDGDEAMGWIASLDASERALVTEGTRGERLLALDVSSGFRERSVIALHRGVAHLERGELAEALRSFAFALKTSDQSRAASTVHPLARRWLSYVLSRFETNAEVLATLKALVPRQDFNPVIEDLVWAAALRGDAASFDRLAASSQRGGSFDGKLERLSLLAHGKPGELVGRLTESAVDGPWDVLRFSRQLLENLEREQADVRRANRPLLTSLLGLLERIVNEPGAAKTNERNAMELAGRAQAMLEAMGAAAGPGAGGRALSLGHSAFAGALRLAPADPLPWPFEKPAVESPSPFAALQLTPIEWRDETGALVFGWRISE